MILDRVEQHVKLCRKNLKNKRVKCCAACPFEDDLVRCYPDLAARFRVKREAIKQAEEEPDEPHALL